MKNRNREWEELRPALRRGGVAWNAFLRCARRLGRVDWRAAPGTGAIDRIRGQGYADGSTSRSEQQLFRVCVSVLCDLRYQGWSISVREGTVRVLPPGRKAGNPLDEKARVRAALLIERDQQLMRPAVRRFIASMEHRRLSQRGQWVSVFSLMRDGRQLAAALQCAQSLVSVSDRVAAVRAIMDPYIQMVDDSTCEHTGLPLKDIWRYFRYTWVSPSKSVPGRNMWFLVRDRAADFHPVIGIGALASSIVQQRSRDKWIGWTPTEFVSRVSAQADSSWAKWVRDAIDRELDDVYVQDFLEEGVIDATELAAPTPEAITRVRKLVTEAKRKHQLYPNARVHKAMANGRDADWKERATTYLFRSKRAQAVADILEIRLALQRVGFTATRAGLSKALQKPDGVRAVQRILRRVKAAHVGINMLDIMVCGAVAPYNHLLGGKLVAVLMASPEVVQQYEEKYRATPSLIASAMAARPIRRRPQLVLLGTTSLYGVGSSQYNRIRIPAEVLDGRKGEELRYCELGSTEGYGSFHFSATTIAEIEVLLARNGSGRRVNSIFGEGVSPRLRKVREALELAGFTSDPLLQHGSPRLVYGVPLAANFRDVLVGRTNAPTWILPVNDPPGATSALVGYWIERWVCRRIERSDVIDAVRQHDLAYPVKHGARVMVPPDREFDLFSVF